MLKNAVNAYILTSDKVYHMIQDNNARESALLANFSSRENKFPKSNLGYKKVRTCRIVENSYNENHREQDSSLNT